MEGTMRKTVTPHVLAANKRILEEGLSSDVTITAANRAKIPCHRNFLIVHSPVLQRMLEGKLKESKSGRIVMDDISEEGVRAFLRFIYYGEVIGQEDSIDLAYEILYAAHKYELPDLETTMKTYLLERKEEDFGASVAFKIYAFVRGIDAAQELKDKMIRVMYMNYGEVKKLPEYKEVFMKNPEDAFELCNNLVEVKRPLKRKLEAEVPANEIQRNSLAPALPGPRPGLRTFGIRMLGNRNEYEVPAADGWGRVQEAAHPPRNPRMYENGNEEFLPRPIEDPLPPILIISDDE